MLSMNPKAVLTPSNRRFREKLRLDNTPAGVAGRAGAPRDPLLDLDEHPLESPAGGPKVAQA